MMKKLLLVLPTLFCLWTPMAHANWEYYGEYVGDGSYNDDGSRFILSIRGGASYGMGSVKNDVGELSAFYYYSPTNLDVVSETSLKVACGGVICGDYLELGYGNIGDLKAKQDYKKLSFAAGASVGWIVPNASNWRLEIGWDRITKTDYNENPLFDGDITLSDGSVVNVQSGAAHSTVSTDVISAMAFYDFFEGIQKPLRTMIPYVGIGIGYANSETELHLIDKYGDLSTDAELRQDYSEDAESLILKFYKSKTTTSNIAGVLALGVSYGINERMFMDFGARLMYIPQIKWALANEGGTLHRDWFSVENMIYANVMLGLRFEF